MTDDKPLSRRLAALAQSAPWLVRLAYSGYKRLQPRFTVGVVGVVFNLKGEVLLAEHVLHPIHPWGLPGGWINRNEQPHEAVTREIQEELSLKTTVEALLLSEITFPRHLDYAYLCGTQDGDSVGHLSGELLSYGWFDPAQTPPLLIFHRRAIASALAMRRQQLQSTAQP
jgi:ADP-ribose pyrophosphatase YjhB (NUDIX family)